MTYAEFHHFENRVRDRLRVVRLTPDADAFIDQGEVEPNWVVPDMLEYGDRVILTGVEGTGKSTLIRQWLVQMSCGIQPLTGANIEPVSVLLVDLENSQSQLTRELAKMRTIAGDEWNPDMFRPVSRPEGIDLLKSDDQKWLSEINDARMPEVIGIGPLYKMFGGDQTDDGAAHRLIDYLNELRGFSALIIEAHSPHSTFGSKRPERPFGSSVWLRWPEFGLFLGNDGALRHWRGPRDAERYWPARLKRGGEWPWSAYGPKRSEHTHWNEITALWTRLERRPTVREIEEELGISKSAAHRIIMANQPNWPSG